jgi:hypothetical protein
MGLQFPLSAASQRDDRALERPSNLTGGGAGEVIAMLLTEVLIEDIQSRGSLPILAPHRGWSTFAADQREGPSGHPG